MAKKRKKTIAPYGPWWPTMRARPVRNLAAEVSGEDGAPRVTVRQERPAWLAPPLSWVIRPRLRKSYRLEGMGLALWRQCDGSSRVIEIVERMAAEHRLTFHEARVVVSDYLERMVKRGLIAVVAE